MGRSKEVFALFCKGSRTKGRNCEGEGTQMQEERYADTGAKVRRVGAGPPCQRRPSLEELVQLLERGRTCQHGKARLIGITEKETPTQLYNAPQYNHTKQSNAAVRYIGVSIQNTAVWLHETSVLAYNLQPYNHTKHECDNTLCRSNHTKHGQAAIRNTGTTLQSTA